MIWNGLWADVDSGQLKQRLKYNPAQLVESRCIMQQIKSKIKNSFRKSDLSKKMLDKLTYMGRNSFSVAHLVQNLNGEFKHQMKQVICDRKGVYVIWT